MKRIYTFLLTVLILCTCSITAFAASSKERILDEAALLTETQKSSLETILEEISERQKVDVTIATRNSINNADLQAYADNLYENSGYGYGSSGDGLILLIVMDTRDWYISTQGYGITAFTDAGIQHIGNTVAGALADKSYEKAFLTYANLADDFIRSAKAGNPYDVGNLPKAPFQWAKATGISFLIALIIAFISIAIMKSNLNSVRMQETADYYTKSNSLKVTNRREFFLYKTVDRVEKPQESSGGSSTHSSSSGTTHGGGGGKF